MGVLSYTPAVPDGPERPWTRGRRTRWWLVVPADVVAVLTALAFAAASTKTLGQWHAPAGGVLGGLCLGWVLAWLLVRGRQGGDHLESPAPEGLVVTACAYLGWVACQWWRAGGLPAGQWLVMAAVLLSVFTLGWRWLYGYGKAHDSLVPKPVARRLAQMEAEQGGGLEDQDGPPPPGPAPAGAP